MHLILHIFKKDVGRLWWGIAIALLIQTAAAWLDTGDRDLQVEGELGLLLTVTWAILLALAVYEDPLVSDRQFWITRPARWRVLLGSKLLFAIAVVHVPSFLADAILLAAHGFRPWEWLASLFIKQLMLAAFTLLMIAIASVLPGFAHLALAMIAIAGLTSFASGFGAGLYSRWAGTDETRMVLFGAVLAAGAVVIVPWQFARRRTWPSRLVGIAAVLVAELLLALLSPVFVARVRAAADPTRTNISLHMRTETVDLRDATKWTLPYNLATGDSVALIVPLTVAGVPEGVDALFDPEVFDLIGPGNQRYQMRPSYIGPDWLVLRIRRELYERLKSAKVELKGSVPVILFRNGSTTSMPVGASGTALGVGHCSTDVIDLPGPAANFERHRLSASCVRVANRPFITGVGQIPAIGG